MVLRSTDLLHLHARRAPARSHGYQVELQSAIPDCVGELRAAIVSHLDGRYKWPTPETLIRACVSGYAVSVSSWIARPYCSIVSVISATCWSRGPTQRGRSMATQRFAKGSVDEEGSRYRRAWPDRVRSSQSWFADAPGTSRARINVSVPCCRQTVVTQSSTKLRRLEREILRYLP